MLFQLDQQQKTIQVERDFEAERSLVWQAWTDPEILDQWWAPEPWKCVTKILELRKGGNWHYYMLGPQGEQEWCIAEYSVQAPETYSLVDAFCDENGVINNKKPGATWELKFIEAGESTRVSIRIHFDSKEDLLQIMEMGMKEGFTMAMENLDRYLQTHYQLRNQQAPRLPRVSSYLNFNGNTEEAMRYYQKIFRGEFTGAGLRRFADVELPADAPPMTEEQKNLIIHAELTIFGNHVLMATDAPESMGFKLISGNNMHINIELADRAETERIYKELSEGGEVSMPLKDMFFGAYFAELKDRYGINWMLHCHHAV